MQFVCKNCFCDKEIVGFIISQGNLGNCNYCNSNNIEIIEFEEFLDFFKELFGNFQIKQNGKSLISQIQDNWNLFSNLECGHKILNEALNKTQNIINNSEEIVDFSEDILENINYWSKLKEQLKWEKRYFTNIELLTLDLGWDAFFESKTLIKDDETYYRARLHGNPEEEIYPLDKMSSPPARYATAGRANPIGIPYLYLSDNEETILYEIRASYLDEISVATFTKNEEYKKELIISDFTESPTLYHPNEVNKKIKSTLLKQLISRDLSKPMRRYDSELDYIPTQFICEFIKIFTNVQGIKFKSSLHNAGSNLVLFNSGTMKCRNVKKVQISNVQISGIDI